MLKLEKRLLEYAEKNILLLQLLLVSAIALFIRRLPIWWNPEDIGAYFDFHANNTQSGLYGLLVGAVQYLPLLPVHTIKWLAALGDFLTATFCLLLVRRADASNRLRQVFCYTMCLFSPLVFLRGVAWAQLDSVATAFFLLGWLLWDSGRRVPALCAVLLSVSLYPCMLVFVIGFACRNWKGAAESGERRRTLIGLAGVAAGELLIGGILALLLGRSFTGGIQSCFAWLFYEPVTGQRFASLLSCLTELLIQLALPGSVIVGILLIKKGKAYCLPVLLAHFLLAVLYGTRLF